MNIWFGLRLAIWESVLSAVWSHRQATGEFHRGGGRSLSAIDLTIDMTVDASDNKRDTISEYYS